MNAKGFAKGAMVGMAAGDLSPPVGRTIMNRKTNHVQKGSTKAVKAVGDFVEGIQTMIR